MKSSFVITGFPTLKAGKYTVWLLLATVAVMFLPWLGETLFNTKGEPREAIVAMSMINSGNWILPVNFGTDIPYKPPFLAWCIAVCSFLTGGVTEVSARMPSAIATIALVMAFYGWLRQWRRSHLVALLASLVFVSNIEVWRAATACRVDMVLTACMVGAMLSLFNFINRRCKSLPWIAIVLMTCAMLTKGPIGIFIPCMSAGLYAMTLSRSQFWGTAWRLVISAILALIIPALWYYAAYQQGGQQFYDLAMEENLGRLTGTMSYESHENPVWYNFQTVLLGMLPYTLLAIMALWAVKWKSDDRPKPAGVSSSVTARIRDYWRGFKALDPMTRFTIIATVAIFVFYCIPKSKRSVYLLPIYPFISYYVALMMIWVSQRKDKITGIYSKVIATVAIIIPVAYWVCCFAPIKAKGSTAMFIGGIKEEGVGFWSVVLSIAIIYMGVKMWQSRVPASLSIPDAEHDISDQSVGALFSYSPAIPVWGTVAILIYLSSVVLPPVLNAKSDLPLAREIERLAEKDAGVYIYLDTPMLRYFTIDFYLNDRMGRFEIEEPQEGWLVVGDRDFERLRELYDDTYTFAPVIVSDHKSCDTKQYLRLIRFTRTSTANFD